MRILVGIDTYGLIGGSERYAISVSRELSARGHQVGVLCGTSQERSNPDLPVTVLPEYSLERASRAAVAPLVRAIRNFRPEVLYLLSARGRASLRAMTRLSGEFPLVRYIQDHTLFCPGLTKMHIGGAICTEPLGLVCLRHYFLEKGCTAFRRELHRSSLDAFGGMWKWKRDLDLARRASALYVGSAYMRAELLKVGLPDERVQLVPLFTQSCSAQAPSTPPDESTRAIVQGSTHPMILASARLALPTKGVDVLLEALAKLRSPYLAVVAGTGPDEAWLKDRARELGLLDRVHFAGWQAASAMEWLYARSHVVAFPSVWDEPFGLVGIEAMAHSKPVVAFDVGGVRDWLEPGVTGFLHPRRDADGFAASLQRLIDEPALATSMGQAGRRKATELYSPQRHVQNLESSFGLLRAEG